MRAAAGLVFVLVLPLAGCTRGDHSQDAQVMQAWIASCSIAPSDGSTLEALAARYSLKAFTQEEIGELKSRIAADNAVQFDKQDRGLPYVSAVEAWWIDRDSGTYVEIAEWTPSSKVAEERKLHRTCIAQGLSESREAFAKQVKLDSTEEYAFGVSANGSIASMRTVDARPELHVDFIKKRNKPDIWRYGHVAAPEDVSFGAGLDRVTVTVGWPAQWHFSATEAADGGAADLSEGAGTVAH